MRLPTLKKLGGVALLAAFGLTFVSGCGDDGIGKRYAVSGTVTYGGKPVESATITFKPEAPEGRGAYGEIKDGSYTLTTSSTGDGAFAGNYLVSITALQVDMKAVEGSTADMAKKKKAEMTPGLVDPVMAAKAGKTAKNAIPLKYASPQTSGLKAEVKTSSNKLDFPLTD